jgi:ABC-2 type transport system permease protein/oleandomycin transport system permease protein
MRRLVTDTVIIAERNLIRLPRSPELLLAFTIQPIMFLLLFRYVFGGAIRTSGIPYVDFIVPGILVQNIAFGGFVTALGLNEDMHKGLIDRFRSLPMSRAAVLAGRTLSDLFSNGFSIAILVITGVIIGFSFHTGFLHALAGLALLLLFGYAFSWVFAFLGLLVSSPEAANDARGAEVVRKREPVHDHRRRGAFAVARHAGPQLRVGRLRLVAGDPCRVRAARGDEVPAGDRQVTPSRG